MSKIGSVYLVYISDNLEKSYEVQQISNLMGKLNIQQQEDVE